MGYKKDKKKETKQILILNLLITLLLIAFTTPPLLAQNSLTAQQVMEKMDARDDGKTRTSDITMILLNKNKQQRIRKIKSIVKDYGKVVKDFGLEVFSLLYQILISLRFDFNCRLRAVA